MSDNPVMIEFQGVGKRYRRKEFGSLRDTIPSLARRLVTGTQRQDETCQTWALRDVSFEVQHGEAMGIIGRNGAGKSTILKLLAGVTAPTWGAARVRGRFAALIELGAGFHPDLTGRENVYLNGSILGLRRAEINRKLESIVDFAGIEEYIDTPIKRYSSGMQARLGFSVAAHVEPDVLLIDEVLSVGDYAFQQKCLQKMDEFRRNGVAIVFVSHNMNSVLGLCSKGILLQTGRVVASGTAREVIDYYTTTSYSLADEVDARQTHMTIERAEICRADGHPSRTFVAGDQVVVKLRLRARHELRDPIIGIGVRNGEAAMVYSTDSAQQKVSPGEVRAGDELLISFPLTLNLLGGTYCVYASIIPPEHGAAWDWWENLITFELLSEERAEGVADLKASMTIERPPGQERSEYVGADERRSA